MAKALAGIRVLDLTQYEAGPSCTQMLAWLGADVIKIEPPAGEAGRTALSDKRGEDAWFFLLLNSCKKGVTLNLKSPRGRAMFEEMARSADVVVENLGPGAMERLGLGYDDLKTVNPRIVYASVTAFGQHGPYARQRGYDILAQAISGYLSITGFPENPPTKSGQSISDYYAGMLCAFSIVSALHYRHRTGVGQRIDMALLDSLVVALDNLGERYTVGGEILTRTGNVAFTGSSTGVYATADGHVAISAGASDAVWRRFCEIVGRDDLTRDPGYATAAARRDRRDEVAAIVQEWTAKRPKAEVVRVLSSAGVPAAPVNNVAEMVADPQVQAREMFVERDHPVYGRLKTTGSPLKMSATPGRVRWLAPMPGEHNEEIFCGLLGHSKDELARWGEAGVI